MKQEQPISRGFKPKTSASQGKLLLLCDGSGTIVFAQGDADLLNRKLDQLRHKHFFTLGFSQYSLQKLNSQAQGGLLEPPRARKCLRLEVVKRRGQKISPEAYYGDQGLYLNELDIKCSLTRVKFSSQSVSFISCRVVKEPMCLLNTARGQHFLTLLEITRAQSHHSYKTSYEDYCFSCAQFQEGKMEVKIQEKQ